MRNLSDISRSYETRIIPARIKSEGQPSAAVAELGTAWEQEYVFPCCKISWVHRGECSPSLLNAVLKARRFVVYVLMGKVKPLALCSVAVGVNTWCGIWAISKEM